MAQLLKPEILTIEGNASCQLRCPTCPTTSTGYPPVVGNGYLKFEDFKNLLSANRHIKEVNLESRGELFLNPDVLPIIECGFRKNVSMTNTSGVNLNNVHDEVLEGLVRYRFKHLLCSIDGASQEIYRMYRVGGDFDRVIDNINIINQFKKVYHADYPKLSWQFIVFGHNEHELPLAKKMAEDLNMSFIPKMSWDSDYSPIRNKDFVMTETGWPAVTREEFMKVTGRNYMRSVCYALWKSPRVNWDGKIMGCCWNSWGEFGGNAFKEGYIPSINSEKLNYAREMLLGKVKSVDDIPCTTCILYIQMKEANDFITVKEIFPAKPLPQRVQKFFSVYPPLYRCSRFIYRTSGLKRLFNGNKKIEL